jgi:hypothetical protein
MADRKQNKPKVGGTVQFNVRVPRPLVARLDKAAEALGTDRSHLMRMILAEQLPVYEERARRAQGGDS